MTAAAFAADDDYGWPEARIDRHHRRTLHLAARDPGGCWIAEDAAGQVVGAALSARREGLWSLALLVVTPEARGAGVGRALLARAMEYGKSCLRGMICSSDHPAAARAYRTAGFALHPTMRLSGEVRPDRLGSSEGGVLPGNAHHLDLLESVDRQLRGGARGNDHYQLLRDHRLLVCDDLAGSGYCYFTPTWGVELLAATSRRLAGRLLTTALRSMEPGPRTHLRALTAEQQWAVDIGLAAGLVVHNAGYLCLRGMRPPTPYIPSGGYL